MDVGGGADLEEDGSEELARGTSMCVIHAKERALGELVDRV